MKTNKFAFSLLVIPALAIHSCGSNSSSPANLCSFNYSSTGAALTKAQVLGTWVQVGTETRASGQSHCTGTNCCDTTLNTAQTLSFTDAADPNIIMGD